MSESDTPLELLPPYKFAPGAEAERDLILLRLRPLLTVAAVYLASEREPSAGKKLIQVTAEDFVQAARSLVVPEGKRPVAWLNDVVEFLLFKSCFISQSVKDKRFCERLHADLQAKGMRSWFFPEDARWGESVWVEIDRAISIYDKLVVVCSRRSLASGPVLREIERALQREDDERRDSGRDRHILFPITIDDYVFDEWQHPRKADVFAKVVGDFRGWNRGAAKYAAAIGKLHKGLQAEEPASR